jgi:hypothetical protein
MVAVGLERPQTKLLGQGERLCIVGGSRFPLDGRLLGREVAQEPQGLGFTPPFPVRPGEAEGTRGTLAGVVQAIRQPRRLAQQGDNASCRIPFGGRGAAPGDTPAPGGRRGRRRGMRGRAGRGKKCFKLPIRYATEVEITVV